LASRVAEPFLSNLDPDLRDVEHGQVAISAKERIIHQRGLAAANINHARGFTTRRALDQGK